MTEAEATLIAGIELIAEYEIMAEDDPDLTDIVSLSVYLENQSPNGETMTIFNGVTCAECVAPIDVTTMDDCIECPECGFTFCDNCYDTGKGDGCHCHKPNGETAVRAIDENNLYGATQAVLNRNNGKES